MIKINIEQEAILRYSLFKFKRLIFKFKQLIYIFINIVQNKTNLEINLFFLYQQQYELIGS